MSDKRITFSAVLDRSTDNSGFWSSTALSLPHARLGAIVDENGAVVPGLGATETGVMVPAAASPSKLVAQISVPDGLRTDDDLEMQKLAFDREKQAISERWQRRTFMWTIASALLSLGATIGGQTLLAPKKPSLGVTVDQLEDCRNSLKRMVTLSTQPGQSIGMLGETIRQHDTACDEILVKLISRGDR